MQHTKGQRVLVHGLFILVLLLALGLRLYRIEAQSLWNDEGTTVALAARDLAAITRGAANDIHPPLYYYLLHFWMAFWGHSELAVRSLSALLGTALVLITFVLTRSLVGDVAALIAALFAACSPFQIYYSQETRMYILSALLAALSFYAWVLLLSKWQNADREASRTRAFIGLFYILVTILLLYTHYFVATILIVQNLAFLWWLQTTQLPLSTRRLSVLLRWTAIQITLVAAYLPWLFLVREQLRVWPAISEPLSLTTLLWNLLCVFSLGLSAQSCSPVVLVGFALLLLVGIVASRPPRIRGLQPQTNSTTYILFLLYLFVPVGALYLLSLQRPMYNPKFLLPCVVPFQLFLAQGICWLANETGRLWPSVMAKASANKSGGQTELWLRYILLLSAIVFVAGSSLTSLRAYYFDPRYARDDYRSIARYIEAVEGEGDAVLINAPGQIETFTYYYQGDLPLYPLPRQRPLDKMQTEADLAQMINGRKRIFAILWATDESDPERFVEGWLDQGCYKAMDSWYGNVRLVIYAVPAMPMQQQIEYPLSVNLGNKVLLLGYNLLSKEVRPGDILQLSLFWQAIAPMQERYKVFTHVLDPYGHLVGQRDAEPGGGAKITTIWQVGEQVLDNYGLLILPATPPGVHIIEIGMYNLESGQRLPVIERGQEISDHIVLQPVHILPALAPPPLSVLGMKKQVNVQFGELTLLGYDLTKLGYEHQPDAPIQSGDVVHLTLFWQANQESSTDIALLLQLRDKQGKVWAERRTKPTEGLYPTPLWHAGEIVRDQHHWFLPGDLPPQRYHIYLSVQRSLDGQQINSPLTLTSFTIQSSASGAGQ
ncbi:MAG: glycosyltransferase family 39 protein [Anaerolineae bacterium]